MILTVLKNVALGPLVSSIIYDLHDNSVRLVRFPGMIPLRTGRSRWSLLWQLQTPGSSDSGLMRIGRRLIGPGALVLSRSVTASEGIRRGWPALSPFAAGRGRRRGGRIEYLFSGFWRSRWSPQSLLASVDSPGYNISILLSNNIAKDFRCKACRNAKFSFQYV